MINSTASEKNFIVRKFEAITIIKQCKLYKNLNNENKS